MPTFAQAPLTDFTSRVFRASGVPDDVADTVARSLVLADMKGHASHGVIRIIDYADWLRRGWINPAGKLTVVRDEGVILSVDGDYQFGQVIGREAVALALDKVARERVCILTIRPVLCCHLAGTKVPRLSMFCEVFAGILAGGACSGPGVDRVANGFFALYVDPAAFCDPASYHAQIAGLVSWVKSSKPTKGQDEIMVVGEPESREYEARRRTGIPIAPETWRKILAIAADRNVVAISPT